MKKVSYIFAFGIVAMFCAAIFSCQQPCVRDVFLETLRINYSVNSDNLGVSGGDDKNSVDTIRSARAQFYNNGDYKRIGKVHFNPSDLFFTSAFAAEDCVESVSYISKMDASKTKFWLNIDYDASAVNEGNIAANTNLLENATIKSTYLEDFENNPFVLGGAETPLSIEKDFFKPINNQWVTFYFSFTELDGTEFMDSTNAFVQMRF